MNSYTARAVLTRLPATFLGLIITAVPAFAHYSPNNSFLKNYKTSIET